MRKLNGLVVQLKRRTEIHRRALRWLHSDDSLASWEISCAVYRTSGILVDGSAAFSVEHLLQPFFRTGLLR